MKSRVAQPVRAAATIRRYPSRQQTVKQYYIGVDVSHGGVNVLAVRGPRNPAHDHDGTLPKIYDLSHRAAVDRHGPQIGCASIQKGRC